MGKKAQSGALQEGVIEVSHPGGDDAAIAQRARRRRGHVTTKELQEDGLGYAGISRRVESGRLHRKHRTVYAVGHDAKAPWAEHDAALLAVEGAVLGFRSGLEVWGALPPVPRRAVDVIVKTPRKNRRGITVHYSRRFPDRDVTRHRNLRVTTPERALLDAAEQIDHRELEIALNELLVQGRTTPRKIAALLERSPGRRGAKILRALLNPDDGYTRNKAERLLKTRVMPHTGLTKVVYNAKVGPYFIDAFIPSHHMGIEIDGFNPHHTPKNHAHDLARQNDLKVNYKVDLLRFAYRTLRDHPERVIAEIARATPSPGTTRA